MRNLFNSNRLWERQQESEFTVTILESRAAPESSGEPANTLSQMLSYRDLDDKEVARVHQYLRADGSIGGKGRPDPKRVFIDGVLYRLIKIGQKPPQSS